MFFLPALLFISLALAGHPGGYSWQHPHGNPLIVEAPSGTYRGLINGSAPAVREFLGVPFAKPPTGDLRWLPPQKLESNSSRVYDATRYPPSCPQYVSKVPSVWNDANTNYIISAPPAEDCLALSIWAPLQGEKLPVIMFVTGGGFQTGGIEINYQLPYHWVQRTQRHIVVTIKYYMSFPRDHMKRLTM
jgi:acetylcholinesterase